MINGHCHSLPLHTGRGRDAREIENVDHEAMDEPGRSNVGEDEEPTLDRSRVRAWLVWEERENEIRHERTSSIC